MRSKKNKITTKFEAKDRICDIPIIQTKNFYLRPFKKDDFKTFYEWALNGEAITENTKDSIKNRLNRFINCYNDLGFTKFAVFNILTNEFVGYCGFELLYDPDNDFISPMQETELNQEIKKFAGKNYHNHFGDLELGYRLHKKYWGKGHATELAEAVCKWAFEELPIDRIVAVTSSSNIASQKVLKKVGFQYLQEVNLKEYTMFYVLSK